MKVLIFCVVLIATHAGAQKMEIVDMPDCSTVKCMDPVAPICPSDSLLIDGEIPLGQCCPPPYQCVCNYATCLKKSCAPGYISVLVSSGSGYPGDCCDTYKCKPICYTQWFDRDNPSGNGDYEILTNLRNEYPGRICSNPLTIQAATLSGVPAQSIGQVILLYNTASGFACVNSQQKNGECCLDYKVRFGCPCPWPKPLVLEEAEVDKLIE